MKNSDFLIIGAGVVGLAAAVASGAESVVAGLGG